MSNFAAHCILVFNGLRLQWKNKNNQLLFYFLAEKQLFIIVFQWMLQKCQKFTLHCADKLRNKH